MHRLPQMRSDSRNKANEGLIKETTESYNALLTKMNTKKKHYPSSRDF